MSYNPSQVVKSKAIMILNADATSAPPDVTALNFTTFKSRFRYYIETKAFFNVSSTVSGFVYYHYWSGFQPLGSVVRGNLVSQTSSGLDDVCIGSNTPNVLLTRSATSAGSASMGTRQFIYEMWRIL